MAGIGVAIKIASIAAKNKDKIGKIIVAVVIGMFLPLILLIINLLSLVSAFMPDGRVLNPNESDISETAIYQSVNGITKEYFDSVKVQLEEEKKKLIEANTKVEKTVDVEGKEITTKRCNMTITMRFNYIGTAYLVSYLQYTGNLDTKTAKINNEAAKKFLRDIGSISVTQLGAKEYEIANTYLGLEEIADKYFTKESDKERFKNSCFAYEAFFGVSEAEVTTETIDRNDISGSVSLLEIPLYLQYSGSWSGIPYGTGTIAKNGCCPTCIAMVFSYLLQQEILPNDITAWTGDRYYVTGAGTAWSVFPAVSEHYGITQENLGKDSMAMVTALKEGKPVIASMGPGTFTKGGHFIVLTGITEAGGITVNDPNDNAIKNHKGREFELGLILRESKNFWSFKK